LIGQNHAELQAHECRVLELAAAWADRHYLDPAGGDDQPLVERACAFGGEGTPEVSECCAAELGALQGIGMWAARLLIADALDLRYRLPRLWDRVRTAGCGPGRPARSPRPPAACLGKQRRTWIMRSPADRAERARTAQDVYSFDSEVGLKPLWPKRRRGMRCGLWPR